MDEEDGDFTLIYAILSGLAPLTASLIPFVLAKNGGMSPRSVHLLLGFSAGLLFAIATLDLIPSALSLTNSSPHHHHPGPCEGKGDEEEGHSHGSNKAMVGVAVGFFSLLFLEQLMNASGHGHSHSLPTTSSSPPSKKKEPKKKVLKNAAELKVVVEDREDMEEVGGRGGGGGGVNISASLSLIVPIGLGIHSFVDGLIVAGALRASAEIGARVIIAIILHKFPDGIVLSSVLVGEKEDYRSFNTKLIIILGVSFMTPLGILLGTSIFRGMSMDVLGVVLGFGSGTFLYISCTGIVPELTEHKKFALPSLIALLGAYFSILLMESVMHAH